MFTPLPAPLRLLLSRSLATLHSDMSGLPLASCYFIPVVPRYFFLYNSIYLPGFPLYMAADTAETRGWTWPGVLLATCENENENVNKECISTVQLVYTVLALDARVPVPDMLSHRRARCSPPR